MGGRTWPSTCYLEQKVLEVSERLLRGVIFKWFFVDILRERDATVICIGGEGTEDGLETADIRFGIRRCIAGGRQGEVFGEGADVATLFHDGTVIIENITDRMHAIIVWIILRVILPMNVDALCQMSKINIDSYKASSEHGRQSS